MQVAADRTDASTAIQTDLPAIFVSLELSRSTWLITSLSPGAGEKMSKHSIRAGDVAGLLVRLAQLQEKARGHCQTKFYTACLGVGTRSSFPVFAHESPPRSARFEAENCLYLTALTAPGPDPRQSLQ